MPGFVIADFRHVADGLQEGQFAVGERKRAATLDDLDPIYRQLLDRPITQTLGLIGFDGRISLTPMWFDYENDKILVNTASHRPKCEWIRRNPQMTSLLVNPENPYHWVQIKQTVEKELRVGRCSRSSSSRSRCRAGKSWRRAFIACSGL